jgi:NitT/TauT family transport system substrate-binding protein
MKKTILLCLSLIVGLSGSLRAEKTLLRVGHFPNITHVQALVARRFSEVAKQSGTGQGWFEQRLGGDVEIQWYTYNAGPSAMEAIFADSIDLTYVGPSPAINAYSKSRGEEIRIVAGAANGGAALVVQPDSNLKTGADFKDKKIATPQLGNTQDVACRAWLSNQGLHITQLGGDAQILPTQNPDQLNLFRQKAVDAVWTVEPWVSRLELEAGGKVLVEESDSVTTVLVSSVKFKEQKRDLLKKFVQAHIELTDWIKAHPEEAQKMVRDELTDLMKKPISPELVAHSWKRIILTNEVSQPSLETFVSNAQKAGFLRGSPNLNRLVEKP